jgi:predicted MPP superfamily phosphohydrolase
MQAREFAIFFSVVFALVVLLHAYVGRRLLHDSGLGRRGRRIGWAALGLSMGLMLFAFPGGRFLERTGPLLVLEWGGFLAMGALLVLFPLLLVRDAGLLLLAARATLTARSAAAERVDRERRRFLRRAGGWLSLGLTGVVVGTGVAQAMRRAQVRSVRIQIEGLPPGLAGLRIAQISDLHLGPTARPAHLREVVEDVNALEVDLVAVTGDLVDGYVDELREQVAPLGQLRARHGVYFVTGNHEYYWDAAAWRQELARLGIAVLHNQHRRIERGGASLAVAGVSDYSAARFAPEERSDPALALRGAEDADFRLLLAHQPRSLYEAREAGYHLQLSGHTHGGQFLPFTWLIHLAHPVAVGLKRFGDLWVYVNRGTSHWGPPLRSDGAGEISLIELVPAETHVPA